MTRAPWLGCPLRRKREAIERADPRLCHVELRPAAASCNIDGRSSGSKMRCIRSAGIAGPSSCTVKTPKDTVQSSTHLPDAVGPRLRCLSRVVGCSSERQLGQRVDALVEQRLEARCHLRRDDRVEQLGLACEVPVGRRGAESCTLRDCLHRRTLVTVRGERLERGSRDAQPDLVLQDSTSRRSADRAEEHTSPTPQASSCDDGLPAKLERWGSCRRLVVHG